MIKRIRKTNRRNDLSICEVEIKIQDGLNHFVSDCTTIKKKISLDLIEISEINIKVFRNYNQIEVLFY